MRSRICGTHQRGVCVTRPIPDKDLYPHIRGASPPGRAAAAASGASAAPTPPTCWWRAGPRAGLLLPRSPWWHRGHSRWPSPERRDMQASADHRLRAHKSPGSAGRPTRSSLGTSWGPHVPHADARRPRSRTFCTVHNVHDVHERLAPFYWGSRGRGFKSRRPNAGQKADSKTRSAFADHLGDQVRAYFAVGAI
jgi:hypothetical protein